MTEDGSIDRAQERHGKVADDIGDGEPEDLLIQLNFGLVFSDRILKLNLT